MDNCMEIGEVGRSTCAHVGPPWVRHCTTSESNYKSIFCQLEPGYLAVIAAVGGDIRISRTENGRVERPGRCLFGHASAPSASERAAERQRGRGCNLVCSQVCAPLNYHSSSVEAGMTLALMHTLRRAMPCAERCATWPLPSRQPHA